VREGTRMKKGQSGSDVFWGVFIVVCVLALVISILGFDQVDASHLGVMVKLGEIKGTMEPGLRWTGVFTHTYEYDMRLRKMTVQLLGEQSATDSTGQAVYGEVSINYMLKQNKDLVQHLYENVGRDEELASKLLIEQKIREGFKQATVQYEAIEILQNRQAVKDLAKENIKANFPTDYFEINDITIENIDFSPEFKQAIEDKKVATQEKLKESERLEVVKLQQAQEIEKYKAEAEKLRLQKAEITDQLNTQKMLEKWDGKLPQYLIITPDSNGIFLQLAQGQISQDDVEE
jgi:prohibitin 2